MHGDFFKVLELWQARFPADNVVEEVYGQGVADGDLAVALVDLFWARFKEVLGGKTYERYFNDPELSVKIELQGVSFVAILIRQIPDEYDVIIELENDRIVNVVKRKEDLNVRIISRSDYGIEIEEDEEE